MAIKGSRISGFSDSADLAKIQPSDLDPFGAPAVPGNRDFWIEVTGSLPALVINICVRNAGVTRVVATATFTV